MKIRCIPTLLALLATSAVAAASDDDDDARRRFRRAVPGGVYAMTNAFDGNEVVAYRRGLDGKLSLLGSFPTGGDGAAFDGGEGLDPLISAYSMLASDDGRFLLVVNAGSNSITAFRINPDASLTRTDVAWTGGVGPNSIAYSDGLVYVSNIDADGEFSGEPDQEGSLPGFRSTRLLGNRPSAVQFSPDGEFLLVSSINAGSAALASGSNDEVVVYRVRRNGRLSAEPVGAATSTELFNSERRNLPSAIGFEIVERGESQFLVVTEAREFQFDDSPPAFPALQTGSASSWRLEEDGSLTPVSLDVLAGTRLFDGERTVCWIEFSADGTIGVFEVGATGLTNIQEVSDLPEVNTQGIVAVDFGPRRRGGDDDDEEDDD